MHEPWRLIPKIHRILTSRVFTSWVIYCICVRRIANYTRLIEISRYELNLVHFKNSQKVCWRGCKQEKKHKVRIKTHFSFPVIKYFTLFLMLEREKMYNSVHSIVIAFCKTTTVISWHHVFLPTLSDVKWKIRRPRQANPTEEEIILETRSRSTLRALRG